MTKEQEQQLLQALGPKAKPLLGLPWKEVGRRVGHPLHIVSDHLRVKITIKLLNRGE